MPVAHNLSLGDLEPEIRILIYVLLLLHIGAFVSRAAVAAARCVRVRCQCSRVVVRCAGLLDMRAAEAAPARAPKIPVN